jgi:urease accessory protein
VHGYAHGSERPASAELLAYFGGFLSATLLLQAAGFALGRGLAHWHRRALRAAGILLGCAGSWLLLQVY